MGDPSWLDYLTAFGSIATPILVALLGVVGWQFRAEYERRVHLETQLRGDRVQIYNTILEPFIIMFMPDAAWRSDPKNKNKDKVQIGTQKALSLDYRRVAFQLALIGSDGVVQAYNDLMQHMFQHGSPENSDTDTENSTVDTKNLVELIGHLLLEIRKSMGNETTELDQWSMLEWFITDAREYRNA